MARGSIIKRGDSYAIKYRDITGRQIWRTVGTNKRLAERALNEALNDINQGNFREPERIGFSKFAEKWLQDYAELKLKPTTVREYRGSINKYLIPYFNDIPLVGITPQFCQSLVTRQLRLPWTAMGTFSRTSAPGSRSVTKPNFSGALVTIW